MMPNKPLSLAVATLLKIGQKHKAAVSFGLQSLVLEMEQEFVDGKLALTCGIRGLKYVDFPCDEAREIALQLFQNKLIPDYTLEETDSAFEENEYMARYSPFDMSQAHELNRELRKLIKDTEKDTESTIQARDSLAKQLIGKKVITVDAFCEGERSANIMVMSIDNELTGWVEFDVAASELPNGKKEGDFVKVLLLLNSDNSIYSHAIIDEESKVNIQSGDICDKEDAKLINDVVTASARDILDCRQRDDVENKVRAILFDMLLTEGISSEDRLVEDLGADSLDLAEILMSIEEEFQIEVAGEDAEKIKTVGQIVDYLMDEKLNGESKPAPQKQVNAELIMKYLKNKGGRATLKQIQSRFKGYSGNSCKELGQRCLDCGFTLDYSDPFKISQTVVR